MEHVNKNSLQMRRNRDFLWVSLNDKRIYLKEQKSCLMLYFQVFKEMQEYIEIMMKRGYTIG